MSTPIPQFRNNRTPPKVVTLILMAGLSALTMNIFLPSLPAMALWFDVPYALMQLSVALYLLLCALPGLYIFTRMPATMIVVVQVAAYVTLLAMHRFKVSRRRGRQAPQAESRTGSS